MRCSSRSLQRRLTCLYFLLLLVAAKQLAWAQDEDAPVDSGTEEDPGPAEEPAADDAPVDDTADIDSADIPTTIPDKPKGDVPVTPPKLPDLPPVVPKPATTPPAKPDSPTTPSVSPTSTPTPNPTPLPGVTGTPATPTTGATPTPTPTPTPIPTATTPTPVPAAVPAAASGTPSDVSGAPAGLDQQQQQQPAEPVLPAGISFLPNPDETAIEGITPTTPSECMTNALLEAMGAEQQAAGSSGCTKDAAKEEQAKLAEYNAAVRGSSSLKQGMLSRGDAAFCVNHEGPQEGTDGSLTSNGLPPTFQSYDPACDDTEAAANNPSCKPQTTKFLESETDADNTTRTLPPQGPPPINFTTCTRGFWGKGSQARSVALVLLKWGRQYYKTRDECCRAVGFTEGCDCTWSGGWTWDRLPAPAAYSRLFTDECDGHPSLNRGYYDLSGGRITFHSKLTVPTPWGAPPDDASPNDNSTDGNVTTVVDPLPEAAAATAAPVGPPQPIQTEYSYQDPDGVDVYGWATLDGMRTESGICRDWCGEAIAMMNITAKDYNHVICYALYSSKAICDTCTGDGCAGTCPAETGISTGCGCGTCYYAWGGQTSCTKPSPPGIRAGLAAVTEVYTGEAASTIAGSSLTDVMARAAAASSVAPVVVGRSLKSFMAHEVGHNLGLTHAGAINCKYDTATIERDPKLCKPDWYGDVTSFMGRGADMQLPNAIKYKVRWLPRTTLRTHPLGSEATYRLRPSTIRRPSKQRGLTTTTTANPNPDGSSDPLSARLRWFDARQTLAVRIRLTKPDEKLAATSSYSCPCNPLDSISGPDGYCPACAKSVSGACANGPCCLIDACADGDLTFMYVELHQPYKDDYNPEFKGVAIRMMGDPGSCTSTRQVPTHLEKGSVKYLLWNPDPTGQAEGSRYEDPLRQVRVILERWDRAMAVVRIWAG